MNDSIERPRRIRKFNPGTFQSDEEVIRQFVVRNRELGIVLDLLQGNVDASSCQHVLLVAPRGRGKTMLLARAAAELRANEEFSKRLLPVRFMEESQEVFNVGDFWLEVLFHLAREQAIRDLGLSQELRDVHAALTAETYGRHLEEHARAAALQAADRLGKQLVLMVENLQSLCRDVDDDFGWKLRKVLQSEPRIVLLATATTRFRELDDARHAFFELFRIVRLEPLDTGACRRLWHMVSGDGMTERRIRPLQILTGGSPRLLIIIGEFAQHRSLRQLMEELVTLVDDHTEYFRGHLEVFAKAERRVYLAVIDLWRASTTGEIAARARMDVRTVSALLGRLVERGAVITEGSGRKRVYTAAERLYSIYYKLRRERDEAAVIRNLVHFMAAFYSQVELDEWSRELVADAVQWPALRAGIKQAIAESRDAGRAFSSGEWRNIEHALHPALSLEEQRATRVLETLTAAIDRREYERSIEIANDFLAAPGTGSPNPPDSVLARILSAKGYAHGQLGDLDAAIACWEEVMERVCANDNPEFHAHFAKSLSNKGLALDRLGETERAIVAFREVIERFGMSDLPEIRLSLTSALLGMGMAQGRLGEVHLEIAAYNQVIFLFGGRGIPELQPAVATAMFLKSLAQAQGGEVQAAIGTCNGLVDRFKDSHVPKIRTQVAISLWVKTKALLFQGERTDAMEAFRSMYAAFVPGQETLMRTLLECVPDLIAAGVSERELIEVLSSEREKANANEPLVLALRQRAGEIVRAPQEVLEVAADVRKRLEAKMAAGDSHSFDTPATQSTRRAEAESRPITGRAAPPSS